MENCLIAVWLAYNAEMEIELIKEQNKNLHHLHANFTRNNGFKIHSKNSLKL